MTIPRYGLGFLLCLAAISCGLTGCLGLPEVRLVDVTPAATPEFTKEVNIAIVTPTQIGVPTIPTNQSLTTVTVTSPATNVQLKQLTQENIAGVSWSKDGWALIYGIWGEHLGLVESWWRYDTMTDEQHLVDPPFQLDPRLWTQWGFTKDDAVYNWRLGVFSPSGTYVLYSRLPAGHAYTPAPDELYYPPYEAWVARTDGSAAVRVHDDCNVAQAIWFEQEHRVIFSCASEGGYSEIIMANIDGSATSSLSRVFGGYSTVGWMALSPDETKLAFIDDHLGLRVATLDGSKNIHVEAPCEVAYHPNWSSDSQRVYFQCAEDYFDNYVDIRVFDVETTVDALFIPSSLVAPDGSEVKIFAGCSFRVSPRETAATFYYKGLWLLTWSP